MGTITMLIVWAVLAWTTLVNGQTCENYGVPSGSSCTCPPGFGGSNCSVPACGGNLFQGSQRSLVQTGGEVSNVSTCACDSGWGGTGCNVCQTPTICQTAFNAVSGGTVNATNANPDQNNTLTCNTSPQVYASGEMSCQVNNPTLQALFSGPAELNILRTLKGSLSPLPNTTSFGVDGSIYAQLIYNGIEQFYCQADQCVQTVTNGAADWKCTDLQCTCRKNTAFCGAVPTSDLTQTIDMLNGGVEIACDAAASNGSTTCSFKQSVIQSVFGPDGLTLNGCQFGECVAQSVIDVGSGNSTAAPEQSTAKSLSGGVIAGLVVVGVLVFLLLLVLAFGLFLQRRARSSSRIKKTGGVGVQWSNVSYTVPQSRSLFSRGKKSNGDITILQDVSGQLKAGELMAILGPSGAGKTTLVECLSGKPKAGKVSGSIVYTEADGTPMTRKPRIGFVDQLDTLPPQLTPFEALLFAANLRLPESVSKADKLTRVYDVMSQLGLNDAANTRIGNSEKRGISGGEMRRVSIGLELVGEPDVLVLDEPTSGLDSVSAMKVVSMLKNVAQDPENPRVVICSIHQPSSKIYHVFDRTVLLAKGKCIYNGAGGAASSEYFASKGLPCPGGYNVADHLLDIASEPPAHLTIDSGVENEKTESRGTPETKEGGSSEAGDGNSMPALTKSGDGVQKGGKQTYATTFLTQLEVLSGRELKILRRDKTLFLSHVGLAVVLGAFCGGLYFKTDDTIAGFQSRVGCLFFLGALIAFSSLSALYNLVEIRALFLRERTAGLYRPTAWLITRLVFDVIPLRIIPTIIVATITYWMAGLAHDTAHFFKFLFILVLYSLAMTLFNFMLACVFRNGGVAILLSALSGLYQMTYAGFFVHLNSIPPAIRWLQWFCPLKYCLEALSVNEVGSGLQIKDVLQGVPVNVSASLIMQLLFGFGVNNYYRDVLVLFAFIAGYGLSTIFAVWFYVRERR